MKLLLENWHKYLAEGSQQMDDIDWVHSYFKNFLKDTKKIGHIHAKVNLDDLPKWLRMGAKGIHPQDFAPSPAWYTSSFAKALEEVSDENRERFRGMFLLLADAIEKGNVDAEQVSLNWYHMAMLVDTINSGDSEE